MKNRINRPKTLDEPGGNPIGDGLVILAGIMARKYLAVKGIRNDESLKSTTDIKNEANRQRLEIDVKSNEDLS